MKRRGRLLFALSFLAPAVLLYAGFVLWPLVQAFRLSLFTTRGLSARETFVAFKNYQDLAVDEGFRNALFNNLKLLGGVILIIIPLGLVMAHIAEMKGPRGKIVRSIYLFPHVISIVVVGILWQFLLHPTIGVITAGFDKLGWKDQPVWLGDSRTALGSVGVGFIWYSIGFYIMLFAAALRGIPADVVEAAELDGASGLRRFFRITWPMIWSVRRVVVIHAVIALLNTFALVLMMTNSGPAMASDVTLTFLYRTGFEQSKLGYATTVAVVNFAVVMLLSGFIMLIFRKDPQAARR
jgi:ABC-type sugar transport system permease subunit